jgi:hypothetical protein
MYFSTIMLVLAMVFCCITVIKVTTPLLKNCIILDDGKSFDYKSGKNLYMELTYSGGKLESKMLQPPGQGIVSNP